MKDWNVERESLHYSTLTEQMGKNYDCKTQSFPAQQQYRRFGSIDLLRLPIKCKLVGFKQLQLFNNKPPARDEFWRTVMMWKNAWINLVLYSSAHTEPLGFLSTTFKIYFKLWKCNLLFLALELIFKTRVATKNRFICGKSIIILDQWLRKRTAYSK